MRKKILLLIMAIVSPLGALAADGDYFEIAGNDYSLNYEVISEANKTCRLNGFMLSNWDWTGSVTIPSKVTNTATATEYTVTQIGTFVFGYNNVTGVILPNTLEVIDQAAFAWSGITSIIIPKSVKSMGLTWDEVGGNPFRGCNQLTSIIIEEGNPRYKVDGNMIIDTQYNAILAGFGNVTIPKSIKKIGLYAFCGIDALTSITIPNGVEITHDVFDNCHNLESVTLPEDMTYIGGSLFREASKLSSILIPSGVSLINNRAFQGTALTEVTIPKNVRQIDYNAFANCKDLQTVTSCIKEPFDIDENVFMNEVWDDEKGEYTYSYPTTLNVPTGTKDLYAAKTGWNKIANIVEVDMPDELSVGDELIYESSEGTMRFTITSIKNKTCKLSATIWDDETSSYIYPYNQESESLTIPSEVQGFTVTAISDYTVNNNWNLKKVFIPKTVTLLGEGFLDNCGSLESIIVEDGNAVYNSKDNCNAIIETVTGTLIKGCKNSTIPEGVVAIADEAMTNISITKLAIPSTLKTIGNNVFYNLESITVADGNTVYNSKDDCNALIETATNKLVLGSMNSSIPEGVTTIGKGAFSNCNIASVTLPSSLETIEDEAFMYCYSLQSIELPSGLTSIGKNAFLGSYLSTVISNLETPIAVGVSSLAISGENWDWEKEVYETYDYPKMLYVPQGTTAAYEAAAVWKEFSEIKEINPNAIMFADENAKDVCIKAGYDADGNAVYPNEDEGITVVTKWDADGDGELTYEEAAAITDIGQVFAWKDVRSFDELKYFTGITVLNDFALADISIVTIPKNVKEIKDNVFQTWNMSKITVDEENTAFVIDGNVLYNKEKTELIKAFGTATSGDFTVSATVKKIGSSAFYGAYNLTSVSMPSTVTSIGMKAFSDCYSLKQFSLPTSLTNLGDNAFAWCSLYDSAVEIPASVTSMGYNVYWMTKVPEFYLPETENPIQVGWGAFEVKYGDVENYPVIHSPLAHLGYYVQKAGLYEYAKAGKVVSKVTPVNELFTFSNAIDVILPEGVEAYIATPMDETQVGINKISEEELTVDEQRVLRAYNGVLLKGEAGKTYDIVAFADDDTYWDYDPGYDAKTYGEDNKLVPVIEAQSFNAVDYYVLKNNAFHPMAESANKVPAAKAVLYAPSGSSYSRGVMNIIGGDDDGTTGIKNIGTSVENDKWYDLQGNRIVAPTKKGLYIKNGKKVIIK